jgi:transcriptional regulator with XRE-family HTH domain
MENVGRKIKEIRLENKLTQKDFAELFFVSQDTISLWENGKSYPTVEYLIAISRRFNVSVDYILCLKDY